MQNIQQLNTTTYKLSSKGTCTKSERLQYKYISCQIPDELLQESPNYKVEQSGFTIKHIHKCNSAGTCSRVVREYKIYTDNKCKCIVDKRQYKEACCCPTEKDINRFQLSSNLSQPVSFSKQCDASKGVLLTDSIKWNLEHGRCWPVLHRTVQPIICSRKESFKPIGFCHSRQQKHLHQREIRVGCDCQLDKRVIMMPCACDPLGNADVVFLVDESVGSRQADYLTNVHKVMKHTINAFYESSQSTNMDESLRFGLLKYSLKTKIVFDLKSYRRLHEVYSELKKLILNNGKQSDLKLALNFVKSKVMPQTRPGAPLFIYIITDGFGNQMPAARLLTDYLKSHNVQINAVLLTSSEKVYDSNFFKQLVSPPSPLHLVELKTDSDQFSRNLSRIADTFCKKACPLNYQKESECSYDTNCIGRTYVFMYRFDPVKGQCVGRTILKHKQCCCMQQVRRKSLCEKNHLILYTMNWQLTSRGFCEKYVTKRDVTGLAISQCTPANQTFIKTCNARGEAVQVTIHRYLKNCRCMTQQTDKIVRCRCTKKYNTKTCFGDDVIVHHYHYERLLDGECLPQRRDVHKKLACKNPRVFKASCDSLTCQQRVTVVTYVAQRCKCKRFVQVKHETCCCKGNRTTSYAGCKHNELKVFEEKIVDPKVNEGSCVQRVRYYFQPITCPNKPSITRHSCRRFDPKAAKQGEDGIVKVDPALIYRIKHKCDPQSGVIVTYRQKVRLEIVGVPIEYTKLNRLNKLSDATCRTHYVMESARKIICPDTKTLVGPCELAEDGRAYKTVKIHKWKQHNCVCQNLPPEIMEKQLCACLPLRIQKKCVSSKPKGPMNKLQIYFIKERLHKVKLPSGKYKNECKVEQTMKEDIIQCPKNILHYSPCKAGKMVVTIKVYKIDNCKCQESIRRSQVRCNVPKKSTSVEHAKSISANRISNPITIEQHLQKEQPQQRLEKQPNDFTSQPNEKLFNQLQSGVCQKQNWQGYTPCSNPRYRDLHIRDQVNCDNMKPTLWCEAQLAADEHKCKDDVFSQVSIVYFQF
ncbi:unnamed protein product [Trichobilharzia regenti]|nr:unnamed protein product [Trichobilharzia regenti]